MDPIIHVKELHKYFGAVEAVRGVSLDVHKVQAEAGKRPVLASLAAGRCSRPRR